MRAIEPSDIVQAFLENKPVDEPIEYIKRICSATSANYPVYFFMRQASMTASDALSVVKQTTCLRRSKQDGWQSVLPKTYPDWDEILR